MVADVSDLKGPNVKREEVKTTAAPTVGFSAGTKAPLSQALRVGDLIFCSGQGPLDPETHEVVAGDFETQVRQTLENMLSVVEAAGGTKSTIAKCNCYLRDVSNFPAFNKIYREFFEECETFPARTTVEASPPREGVDVEIECTAVLSAE